MHAFNPMNHPICFALPLRMASSFWVQHVPFGMFLIDLLRPKIVVELGAFNGLSHGAFCQAVKELKIDAKCYAIDSWQGDRQNGFYGAEILAQLKFHHDPLYGSHVKL